MSFLSPLYLIGALAVIAPILLHLRRRPPKDFVPFSTLMFLDKTPERLTRRSKLERLWLLLLRCLALLLLALLFARPFFDSDKTGPGGSEGSRVVVLLDRSASMQREDLWKQALIKADQVLSEASGRDEIALLTFDDQIDVLSGFNSGDEAVPVSAGAQVKAARAALGDARAGWGGSGLGGALIAAADLIEASTPEGGERMAKEIVVISDFQEGAERDSLNRYAWPESIRVRCVPVAPEQSANLALNLVATLREGEDDDAAEAIPRDSEETESLKASQRVRIRNSRTDGREVEFSLRWADARSGAESERGDQAVRGLIPPGSSRVVVAPPRAIGDEAADGVLVLQAEGGAADHDFDNRAYVARVQPRPVRVLYLSAKPEPQNPATALFYLMRAMQPTSVLTPEVEALAYADVSEQAVKNADLVVVAGAPPLAVAGQVGAALDSGAAVFWISRAGASGVDQAESAALAAVTGIEGWSVSESTRDGSAKSDYAMLTDLDFESPVLAPFARAGVRDFTGIHIWKNRALELPEDATADGGQIRVLARYDGSVPAWVEVRRGAGKMYLFTSGWEPAESQLALSSKFVPLLYAMLGEAGFSALLPSPLVVGEPLPAPPGAELAQTLLTVKLPDGSSVESNVNEGVFQRTELPGLYTVSDGAGERVYAVNLAADESRVESVDPMLLADFSVPVRIESEQVAGVGADGRRAAEARAEAVIEQRRLELSEKENRQKLWKWLVLAVLGVLLLESWVAGRAPGASEVESDSDREATASAV